MRRLSLVVAVMVSLVIGITYYADIDGDGFSDVILWERWSAGDDEELADRKSTRLNSSHRT